MFDGVEFGGNYRRTVNELRKNNNNTDFGD